MWYYNLLPPGLSMMIYMYMCMYNRSTRVRLTVHWNKGLFTVVVERECVCVDLTRVPGYEGVNSEYKFSIQYVY